MYGKGCSDGRAPGAAKYRGLVRRGGVGRLAALRGGGVLLLVLARVGANLPIGTRCSSRVHPVYHRRCSAFCSGGLGLGKMRAGGWVGVISGCCDCIVQSLHCAIRSRGWGVRRGGAASAGGGRGWPGGGGMKGERLQGGGSGGCWCAQAGRAAGRCPGVSPAGDARAGPTQMRRRPAEGADVEEGVIAGCCDCIVQSLHCAVIALCYQGVGQEEEVSSEAGPPLPAGGRVFGQVGSRGSG